MTGVQTCALPISAQPREYDGVDARRASDPLFLHHHRQDADFRMKGLPVLGRMSPNAKTASLAALMAIALTGLAFAAVPLRSEEQTSGLPALMRISDAMFSLLPNIRVYVYAQ